MARTLNEDVGELLEELDQDGSGFRTGEAANILVQNYVNAGVCDADGQPKPKVRVMMRLGAVTAVKNYKITNRENQKSKEHAAEAAAGDGVQADFSEMDEGFEHQWLYRYAALDEGADAERKMMVNMTYHEALRVIALKLRKAAQNKATADLLQGIIDSYPGWKRSPHLTIGDIMNITGSGD